MCGRLAANITTVVGHANVEARFDRYELTNDWNVRINARQLESYEFETSDAAPNPVPSKAMLRTLGHAVGECRSPMGPTPHGLEHAARGVYQRLVAARG